MSHYPKAKKRPINTEIAPPGRSAVDDPAVWVQFVRASRGWSQEELAEAAKMHPSQISAYETGLKIPRPATRARLAAAAGTTPEAVIEAAEVLRRRPKVGAGTSISRRAASFAEQTRRQFEAALDRAEESLAPGL
ncbi:MAG: helix-turn-helix transcriptional regulator [Acidobacteriota bacterium]